MLVSKQLDSNLPQLIAVFEHCKCLVCSMKNAQLSFIDWKEWTKVLLCYAVK